MTTNLPDDWERVEKQQRALDSPDTPLVSVHTSGDTMGLLKHAYQTLGEPKYVCFFKSDTKVRVEPRDEEGGLNPHKVYTNGSDGYTHIASFAWHDCDEPGYAPLQYSDEHDIYYFDTEDLSDE